MARNDVYININALSPADAVVTGQQDMTAATVPELVLGDTPTFNFYFTDNTNVWPSWAGNASYSLTWALSDAVAGDFAPAATTSVSTPITGGWSVVLPLNSYDLVGLLNTKRVGQPYPVTNLWQQLRVTDPSGNEITRAMFWTPVRYRAISDTQNTESATPTGGRIITTLVSNALQNPTAAQFYAANPVPTSALGTAANGELLIGNGTGFTKSTLTAGTGVSITNGSGSITIDASGAQETLTATVKNAESVAITKGQVVYLFGATGGFASVKLAYNTSDATSAKTFGVVSSTSIAANGTGTVTCVGVVDGLNLGAYNDGDTLYLGATPGSVTATKPYAPNHLVYVGIVERANAGNGELYVRVQNGYELDEIHDVQINAPRLAGQTLIYDQTNDLWKNARLTGTANQITVTNADAAVTLSIPTNPTLNGNLTVSGKILGGNSSDSGAISTLRSSGTATGLANVKASSALTVVDNTTANTDSAMVFGVNGSGAYIQGLYTTVASTITLQPYGGSTTLGGNLTVSGTGNSSFAGSIRLPWSTPSLLSYYDATYSLGFVFDSTNRKLVLRAQSADAPANGKGTIAFESGATPSEIARFAPSTGNLLLKSDGIDSGNGKLQLATHSTSAGGIGFGTSTSLYTDTARLVLVGGTTTRFRLSSTSGNAADFQFDNSELAIGNSSSIRFYTTGGTALTLDSSQNATFAGRSSATTAYGTAKSVTVDFATSTATNVTRTFTVTIPSPGLAGTFLLEVGIYGNGGTGLGSLLVKGYGYFGSASLYDATEISKVSTGNVTVSSITKGSGSFTFTVLDTTASALVAVKYSQTSDAAITTLPTITSA